MGFPRRLLGEDESVVLDLHPHWKRLVGPALLLVVVAGGASYGEFAAPTGTWRAPVRIAVAVVAVAVLVRGALVPWLRWLTTRYVLTTHRVVVRQGVLGRSGRDIPLTRVTDVAFRRTLLDRLVGSGSLTIESGGEHGQAVLPEVPHVELVQREIYRCVEAFGRRDG
jgi:uncharacterized membrane protein YdbT with pleckstrin-like domain